MTATHRTCGCLGCTNDATAKIGYGPSSRVVCDDHIGGYTVLEALA